MARKPPLHRKGHPAEPIPPWTAWPVPTPSVATATASAAAISAWSSGPASTSASAACTAPPAAIASASARGRSCDTPRSTKRPSSASSTRRGIRRAPSRRAGPHPAPPRRHHSSRRCRPSLAAHHTDLPCTHPDGHSHIPAWTSTRVETTGCRRLDYVGPRDFPASSGLSLIVNAVLTDFEVVTIPLAHAGFVERGDLAECFGSSSCAVGADIGWCRTTRPRSRTDESSVRR
jgi:hypothetical protein